MSVYPVEKIRNITLLGHSGDGKTSLAESILYMTKQTDRLGKVADGNTVSDFDPEEIKRKISISMTALPVEFGDTKFNFMDTPGYFDFVGEVDQSLRVADAGVIVCTAKSGVGVGTEKAWKKLRDRKIPRAFYISKLDEENANFDHAFETLREAFGSTVTPMTIPIMDGDRAVGIVDIVTKTGYRAENGKILEMPVPPETQSRVEELYAILMENVAEASEEFMDKYFAGEEFTLDEVKQGIRAGVLDGSLAPVFCGSAFTGVGTLTMLRGLAAYMPSPADGVPESAEGKEVLTDPNGAPCAIVFKTTSDQYGKFSFFKVISGSVRSDMTLTNARTGSTEKIGHLYQVRGKKNTEIKEVTCGDIGAVSKLQVTKTGDTLCDAKKVVALPGISFAKPCYSLAIMPKSKGGEEKIASGLARLAEEDPTFTVKVDPETHQMVVSAAGDIQIDVLCAKLRSKFNVETETAAPRVPYREKIRKKVKVQGRHKKQSGGHGQFGDVWIEFEPQSESEDLIFEEKIFGGSVPKNFHPAVEKGLREAAKKGVVAGFPVVYLKATLVDGSYHDVDSSEMAFKTAASLAYKAGLPQANPVLLEPIGALKVLVPGKYMGDVIGDLNKRRGRVLGMNPGEDGQEVVEAEVPMAEMSAYAIDLRSMTQGRGSFELDFVRYEETPPNVQQKVVEENKQFMEE